MLGDGVDALAKEDRSVDGEDERIEAVGEARLDGDDGPARHVDGGDLRFVRGGDHDEAGAERRERDVDDAARGGDVEGGGGRVAAEEVVGDAS
jgi:hypothetical protein